jgi:hypothetical protein
MIQQFQNDKVEQIYVDILKHTTSYYRMVSLYNMDWRHLASKKWLPPTSLCRDQCLMQRSVNVRSLGCLSAPPH